MAETPNSGSDAGKPEAAAAPTPVWQLVGQYIRDLSFENPGAPASILQGTGAPKFDVNINVQVKREPEDIYAVELTLTSKAVRNDAVLFNVELVYGGMFRVKDIPEDQLAPLLMIESPRMIFPFARQVLANVTQAGGFPPLMMEPVDFATIYRRNVEAMAQAQKEKQEQTGKPN
jgi:preprotein translocase subunit SecB